LNVAAYFYDYQNYRCGDMQMGWGVNDELPIGWGGTRQPLSSEVEPDPNSSGWGDGQMKGLDLQSTFLISPKDIMNMSVSYLKSEWTDLVFDYYWDYKALMSWPPPPRDVIIPISVEPFETVSFNGKPMVASPKWTINVSYSHRFSLGNGGDLEFKVDGQHKTEYRLAWRPKDYPYDYQEPFTTYNTALTYNSPDGNWSLSAYGRNLTNYAEKRMYMGEPVYQMSVGNPRTYGAVNFQVPPSAPQFIY
jgi:iron complex outermembrane receptor protein